MISSLKDGLAYGVDELKLVAISEVFELPKMIQNDSRLL